MEREVRRGDAGFSLIEVCVVVLILGILIGLAIPTFTRSTDRGHDTRARSNATNALRTAKAVAIDKGGDFTGVDATLLQTEEGALTFVDGATESSSPDIVSEIVPDAAGAAETVVVVVESDSGVCMFAKDGANGPTEYAEVDLVDVACKAEEFVEVPAELWKPKW